MMCRTSSGGSLGVLGKIDMMLVVTFASGPPLRGINTLVNRGGRILISCQKGFPSQQGLTIDVSPI